MLKLAVEVSSEIDPNRYGPRSCEKHSQLAFFLGGRKIQSAIAVGEPIRYRGYSPRAPITYIIRDDQDHDGVRHR